jgi:hypothetical protein
MPACCASPAIGAALVGAGADVCVAVAGVSDFEHADANRPSTHSMPTHATTRLSLI